MKKFVLGFSLTLSTSVFAAMGGEPLRLSKEGYDMSACQFLPSSSYNVGVEEETLKVTFVNDTGNVVTPAYTDLKGDVKFLRPRGVDQVWKDSTYIGTIWVWFSDDKTCLGISPSKYEWSDQYQFGYRFGKSVVLTTVPLVFLVVRVEGGGHSDPLEVSDIPSV